jgi:hypothetical protein
MNHRSNEDEYDQSSMPSPNTFTTNTNNSVSSNLSDTSCNLSSPSTNRNSIGAVPRNITPSRSKKPQKKKKKGLTPSEAKKIQKDKVNKNRKSIATSSPSSGMKMTVLDKADRDVIVESRDIHIDFERKKHDEMNRIEEEIFF